MNIRSLPPSRRSKNRRRSGRWIRSAILDRKWVAPAAKIGLYLLDDKRRETERAVDHDGEPIALAPTASESDLIDAIRRYGDGRYRLVARDREGRILARRDFVAAIVAHHLDAAIHEPRTEVERLKSELTAARDAAQIACAERDAARAEAETLKRAIAERDAEIAGLESALDQQGQALRRARRLYAELGGGEPGAQHRDDAQPTEDEQDEAPEQGADRHRPEHASREHPPTGAQPREDAAGREPKLFGLGRAELKEIAGIIKELINDEPSADSRSGVDPPAEDAEMAGAEGEP